MKIIKPTKNKQQDRSTEQGESNLKESAFRRQASKAKLFENTSNNQERLPSKAVKTKHPKKAIVDTNIESYSGSDIDIFADDESWDKVEYSRTDTDLNRFKKNQNV